MVLKSDKPKKLSAFLFDMQLCCKNQQVATDTQMYIFYFYSSTPNYVMHLSIMMMIGHRSLPKLTMYSRYLLDSCTTLDLAISAGSSASIICTLNCGRPCLCIQLLLQQLQIKNLIILCYKTDQLIHDYELLCGWQLFLTLMNTATNK